MSKKMKQRQSLKEILASCSDTLFPDKMGKAPVSVDSRDVDGDTPLHVMLGRNDTYAALLLIEAGADINAVGDMSETPLHIALHHGNLKAIGVLLQAGANVTAMSEFGKTPIDLANDIGGETKRLFANR
mgnify:FL=1